MKFLAGLALFFLGIELSKTGTRHYGSHLLNRAIDMIGRSSLVQGLSGFLITLLLQSSSAATILFMSLGSAGLLSLKGAYPMLLGSGIGTTVVVKLISFKFSSYSPLLMFGGIILLLLSGKKELKFSGSIITGMGLLFFSMELMRSEIQSNVTIIPHITSFIEKSHGFLIFLAGFFLTVILNASAVVLGIAMIMAGEGVIDLHSSLIIVLGANAGTTVTDVLASISTPGEGRRIAFVNVLFKFSGAFLFLLILNFIPKKEWLQGMQPERVIADFHILFNIVLFLFFLPLKNPICNLFEKLWVVKPPVRERFYLKFIKENIPSPSSVVIKNSRKEIARLLEEVKGMIEKMESALEGDKGEIEMIKETDELVDFIEKKIRLYLISYMKEELSPEEKSKMLALILLANNLENIGDVITKNLSYLAEKKMRKATDFSEEGKRELTIIYNKLINIMDDIYQGLTESKKEIIEKIKEKNDDFLKTIYDFKIKHIERLKRGVVESLITSSVHIDILSNYERISAHIKDCIFSLEEILN